MNSKSYRNQELSLELAIGHQIKEYRRQLKMTVTEVAKQADLSPGMLSKN